MKITYAVILCVLLLLVSACAQKVNDPTDVQAIKDTQPAFDKAWNAGNAEGVASGFYRLPIRGQPMSRNPEPESALRLPALQSRFPFAVPQ